MGKFGNLVREIWSVQVVHIFHENEDERSLSVLFTADYFEVNMFAPISYKRDEGLTERGEKNIESVLGPEIMLYTGADRKL